MSRIKSFIEEKGCFHASTEDSLLALFVELTEDIGMDEDEAISLIEDTWAMVANEYGG